MRHLVKTGMNDLIVHGEHEDIMEELLHGLLEVRHAFAIHMPRLTNGGCIVLRFQ